MKKFPLGVTAGLIGAAAIFATAHGATNKLEAYHQLDFFGDAFARVSANYIREPSYSDLVGYAIQGMVARLDSHSVYWNKKQFDAVAALTRGDLADVGIGTAREYGFEKVTSIVDGGPAAVAGIKRGDYIAAIDDRSVVALSSGEAVEMLAGQKNSAVKLTVLRKNERKPLQFNLARDSVKTDGVKYRRVGEIGYVRIDWFVDKTESSLKKAIADLRTEIGPNLKGFVLDLRESPGGPLDAVIAVADDFLNSGKIVSLRGRRREDNKDYDARRGDLTDGAPIVVLIDEGTASGAEIVAAALQDNHRAKVVGMTSAGQGAIGTIIPIGAKGDGGALRLTTAYFLFPSGRAMEPDGVRPDLAVSQFAEGYDPNESPLPPPVARTSQPSRNVIYPESGKTYDDFQLSMALNELDRR